MSSTTSTTFGGGARPINWYEVMGRYQGNFRALGVYGIFGYSGSGNVSPNYPAVAGSTSAVHYNGFSVLDVGVVLSYAGFSFGGNVQWGAYNNAVALKPQGAPDAIVWLVGGQYIIGPLTLAASYYNYQYQGSAAAVGISQRYDDAFAADVIYNLAPGLNAYAEYVWGQAHQGGVNLYTGALSPLYNNTHNQALIIGTRVQW